MRKIEWKKLGLIFNINDHDIPWLKSHAMTPTPLLYEDRIRVFYSGRSYTGESKISYVDLDINDPTQIIYVHKDPLFEPGDAGMFDDSGVICTCALRIENKVYLYYTAYSMSVKVPYRNSIGVAVSEDDGNTFKRMFDGPILDRDRFEPYFVISPWVIKIKEKFHLWYGSSTGWIKVKDNLESIYHIKYAHSKDGLNWVRENKSCILPAYSEESIARPTVIAEGEKLKMWFTYRGSRDFRDGTESYRIGYAESNVDAPDLWIRKDEENGISSEENNYDNLMQAYPSVITTRNYKLLIYNGNSFGKDGFCCAIEELN